MKKKFCDSYFIYIYSAPNPSSHNSNLQVKMFNFFYIFLYMLKVFIGSAELISYFGVK